MGLQRFNLETIGQLDGGRPLEAFAEACKRAVKDCIDRPGDKRKRKVVLQLTLEPQPVISGNTIDCDSVEGAFQCRVKIPDWETTSVNFGVQNSGDLLFNPDSPNDHRQMTLLDGDGREVKDV